MDPELTEEEERFLAAVESQHSFPGPFTVKAICRNAPRVDEVVVAAIRERAGVSVAAGASTRASSAGRYVSVTFELQAESGREVVEVYRVLRGMEQVVTSL